MQAFTRITRLIYSCLVIGLHSSFKVDLYIYKLFDDTMKKETKVDENLISLQIAMYVKALCVATLYMPTCHY